MVIHFLFNPNAILYHTDIHFPLHLPVIHHLINLSPCSTHLLNIPIQSLNLRLDFHIMIDLPCWIPILRRFRTLCADIPLAPLGLPVEALKPRGLTDGPITNSTTFTSSGSAYFDYYTTTVNLPGTTNFSTDPSCNSETHVQPHLHQQNGSYPYQDLEELPEPDPNYPHFRLHQFHKLHHRHQNLLLLDVHLL